MNKIHLSRGRTLLTLKTRTWSKEEWDKNDAEEKMMLFAYFTPIDQGRGRILIARFENEKRLIRFKRLWNTAHPQSYPAILKGKRDTKEIKYSKLREMVRYMINPPEPLREKPSPIFLS